MAFTLNNYSSANHFFTVTMHDTQGNKNRVVHVIVPNPAKGRALPAETKKQAKAAAKKALQDAAASL